MHQTVQTKQVRLMYCLTENKNEDMPTKKGGREREEGGERREYFVFLRPEHFFGGVLKIVANLKRRS